MRISDWSSDVCSSDLERGLLEHRHQEIGAAQIGAVELRVGQVGAGEIGTEQIGAGELRRFQRGPGKAAARQDGMVEVGAIELEIGKIPPAALQALAAGPTGQLSIVARQGPDDGLWRQARGHGELRAEGGRYVTDSTATLDKPTPLRHAFVPPNAVSLPSRNCHGNTMAIPTPCTGPAGSSMAHQGRRGPMATAHTPTPTTPAPTEQHGRTPSR